jgi:hypothetical protein
MLMLASERSIIFARWWVVSIISVVASINLSIISEYKLWKIEENLSSWKTTKIELYALVLYDSTTLYLP